MVEICGTELYQEKDKAEMKNSGEKNLRTVGSGRSGAETEGEKGLNRWQITLLINRNGEVDIESGQKGRVPRGLFHLMGMKRNSGKITR